ncbi:MAG: enoyl-CoA hydratase/isomerase family protein [Burkholderiales bacterium]
MSSELLVEIHNHIAFVTLNRPQALNSLSYAMVKELSDLLSSWENDDSIHAVLVRGAGEKAFCAGGDVRFIYDSFNSGGAEHLQFFSDEYKLDHQIHRYPKPYIALMDGIVMGGGMGIAQGAQFRTATDRTRMAMPETAIGLFPDVGASYFLSRLEGAMGTYLGITGKDLKATDILAVGLGDIYLDTYAVVALDDRLKDIAWSDDYSQDIEMALNTLASEPAAPATLDPLADAIDIHFSEPTLPAIIASLKNESHPALTDWATQTLAGLNKRSPLMTSVTLEQLHRGRKMSLADCFRMELNLVHACFDQGDFIEGVRALIVEKTQQPRWNPPTPNEVTQDEIDDFFVPRWSPREHPLSALD